MSDPWLRHALARVEALRKAIEQHLDAPPCDDPECDCPYKSQWLRDALQADDAERVAA